MANRPNITDQFDPEQIYQIIEYYLSVVGRRQYIGARYVPIFGRLGEESIEWDNTAPYEPLTIVLYQGNSFTSRQYVPTGIDIDNVEFWAETGNYNAQVESYRREVLDYKEDVDEALAGIADIDNRLNMLSKEDLELALRDCVFAPYTRTILKNTDDTYASFQVSTMDENEQYIYVITPYADVDQATTKESILRVINPQTGETIVAKELPVGHGRSLTVKNDIMLTSNQYAESNNEWVAIDISNKINPEVVSRGNFNGRHMFWTDEGAACYTGENTIKFFDVEYDNDGYPTSFTENGYTITFTKGIKGEEQSFQYWNGYIIISCTLPEAISVIDATNGKQAAYIPLKENYSFLRTAECESAFIVNNHLYFSNNSTVPSQEDGIQILEFSMFRCDFLEPKGEWYDYWLKKSYQSSRGQEVYVSGDRPSASSVSSDGGVDSPFWFVGDAFTSYTAQKRMRFSENTFNKYLSINFTQEEYPYKVYISNANEWFVGINGYGSDTKTTIPCLFAFNANLMVNRLIIDGVIDQEKTGSALPVAILALKSIMRARNTLEFTNDTTDAIDILADYLSDIEYEGTARRVVAYRASTIKLKGITKYTATDGGKVETTQVPVATDVTQFSGGASSTQRWVNFVHADGSMHRLFVTNSNLRLAYYPDATQTGTSTDVWTITKDS